MTGRKFRAEMPEVTDASIDEMASCLQKVRWSTEDSALRIAIRSERLEREPFEAYPCKYCGGWHTAHARRIR
jgi:hypothetical protein